MTISNTYPFILQNGTTADASQVMADFYQIQSDVNANAAHNGANTDITSLSGLTTPLSIAQGGTGLTNYTNYNILVGQGSSIGFLAPSATAGQALISAGAGALPVWGQVQAPGLIFMYGGATAPAGWLECDGSAVSRTTYAALLTAIGTTYGNGDGSTTFNLPDMRGYFPRGWDHGRGVDPSRALGSTQADAFKTHTHTATVTDPGHRHNVPNDGNYNAASTTLLAGSPGTVVDIVLTSPSTTGITVANASTGGSETRPVNLALMFCIKY